MKKLSGKIILVVDDEPELRELLADEFQFLGAQVLMADSGNAALEVLKKNLVHVVVSDVRMPNGTGDKLLVEVKKLNLEIPMVLLMTGNLEFDCYDAYDLGADAVFSKPYDINLLVDTVVRTLMPTKDKLVPRKHNRIRSDFKTQVEIKGSDGKFAGSILSIGRGGMFIAFKNQMPGVGEEIFFEIDDGKNLKISGTAICRWSRKDSERGLPNGGGFEFSEISPESVESLEAFLKHRQITAFIPKS